MAWYAIAIVYVYGTWVAWVLLNNRFPLQGTASQLFSLAWITGLLIAATGTLWSNATSSDTLAGGMAVSIAALGGQYVWAARTDASARRATWLAAGFSLLAALLLALGALTPIKSDVVIAVAPAVALVPLFAVYPRLLPAGVVIRSDHLRERFGQLVLIVMGDALLETVLNVERGSALSLPGLLFAVLVLLLVWRAYFLHVLPIGPPTSLRGMQAWVLAHLLIVLGVGFSAAGVAASASPLPDEALAELEQLSHHVPLGVILGIAYVGFAWAVALHGGTTRRAAVTLLAGALVVMTGSLFLEVMDSVAVGAAVFILLVLAAVDAALSRARRPGTDSA